MTNEQINRAVAEELVWKPIPNSSKLWYRPGESIGVEANFTDDHNAAAEVIAVRVDSQCVDALATSSANSLPCRRRLTSASAYSPTTSAKTSSRSGNASIASRGMNLERKPMTTHQIRSEVARLGENNPRFRVLWMNTLHDIAERRPGIPKNKLGQPVVSDFDKWIASDEEIVAAWEKVKGKI